MHRLSPPFRSSVLLWCFLCACSGSSPPDSATGDAGHGGGGATGGGGAGGSSAEGASGSTATGGVGPTTGTGGGETGGGAGTSGSGGTSASGGNGGTKGNGGAIGGGTTGGGGTSASGGGGRAGTGGFAGAAGAGGAGGGPAVGGSAGGGRAGTGGLAGAAGAGGGPAVGGSAGGGRAGTSGLAGAAGGYAGTGGTSGAAGGGPGETGGTLGGGGGATGGKAGTGGIAGSGGAGDGGSSSPAVRIVGRTGPGGSASSTEYSWPGVNIQARFSGTQVSMAVNNATGNNRITVVVDGGTPKIMALASGTSTVSLASGLSNGTHDILIWRNTEASPGGVTTFNGLTAFASGGALLAPASAPDRLIEVVGDSLSVGAGVEGDSTCTGGIDAYTDNYLAYGSIAARAVSADVVTIAYSGIGVYRNSDGTSSLTMPQRYPYALPDTVLWNFALYQPDVVVINLGTNDFETGDPGVPYETAYVTFVQTIRQKYPNTYFILIDMYGGNRLTRINDVVATLKTSGESKVEVLSLDSVQNTLGCNQHPNVAGQQAMGTTLAAQLHVLFGW
jgi:lysophospholipase L1-like esterase